METDAAAVSAYIVFLAEHTRDLELKELDKLAFVSELPHCYIPFLNSP